MIKIYDFSIPCVFFCSDLWWSLGFWACFSESCEVLDLGGCWLSRVGELDWTNWLKFGASELR